MGRMIFDTLERDQSGYTHIVNDRSGDPATGPSSTSASAEIHGSIPTVGGGSATPPIY